MDRAPQQPLERLGSAGLSRVLGDVLDQKQLARLATACGVKYRGMRIQTQSRERLVQDLVERAEKYQKARTEILRTLRKETVRDVKEWKSLDADERARRLFDDRALCRNGGLGRHLYLLATDPGQAELDRFAGEFAHRHLLGLAAEGNRKPESDKAGREDARLRRRVQDLEKKAKHLETQLAKSREAEKSHKRDLIERKGELAESRMLAERLGRDLAAARNEVEAARKGDPSANDKALAELARRVKQLGTQQRKLAHTIEKPGEAAPGSERLASAVAELRRDILAAGAERDRSLEALSRQVESLTGEISKLRSKRAEKIARRNRARGPNARVGVFIDVQNMYYGARRLKGKVDFDALLDAAVGKRRLIQTTAYVIETKEIDQSQFIQLLQKRAIDVRRKTLTVRSDGSMKGDWDMELALDVLDATPDLDVVVLVSGDGDFTSLVRRVKTLGPRVEVIAFPRHTAKALVEAADDYLPLDRKLMIYPKASRSSAKTSGSGKTSSSAKAS